jgi:hypothetical protein
MVFLFIALRRIGRGIYSKLYHAIYMLGWICWDLSLALVNLLTFKRKVGRVTPKGLPGEGGVWPEYIPPREGYSRCACPGLNTMANHGLLFLPFHFILISSSPRDNYVIPLPYPPRGPLLNRFLIFPPAYQVLSLAMGAISLSSR